MDESASMLCARVMRGISSIANRLTLRAASSAHASGDVKGFTEADHNLAGCAKAANRRGPPPDLRRAFGPEQ